MSKIRKGVVYQDSAGQWRWRILARNGKKIATSGEGYWNKSHAVKMCKSFGPDEMVIETGEDDGHLL